MTKMTSADVVRKMFDLESIERRNREYVEAVRKLCEKRNVE